MSFRELLKQTYNEHEMYEFYKREKDMKIEDIAGIKGVCYDAVKVSGTKESDLADVVEKIMCNTAGISLSIIKTLNELQRHRKQVYECLSLVPNCLGKLAVTEHYLYGKPWKQIAIEQNYGTESIKRAAYECIDKVEEALDKDDAK